VPPIAACCRRVVVTTSIDAVHPPDTARRRMCVDRVRGGPVFVAATFRSPWRAAAVLRTAMAT